MAGYSRIGHPGPDSTASIRHRNVAFSALSRIPPAGPVAAAPKEETMHGSQKTVIKGLCFILCMVVSLVAAMPLMAEYTNVAVTDTSDPAYWVDRGALYATYGSYTAAVKAYNKALTLDANNSKAYFNRGLSYAELGDYTSALADINKAIALDSGQAGYFYGRGRVKLISGNKDEALADFRKAAAMGNSDAGAYLDAMR